GHVSLSGSISDANGVASVEVFDGTIALGTAGMAGGVWSFSTVLGEGSHTLSAVATDFAGNPTATDVLPALVVDTIRPTLAIDQALADASGVSAFDPLPIYGHVSMSGSISDANGVASVEVFDGTTDLGAASLVGGAWSFSTVLGEGSHTLSAVATDLAGNLTATAAQPTILVDRESLAKSNSQHLAHDPRAPTNDEVTQDG